MSAPWGVFRPYHPPAGYGFAPHPFWTPVHIFLLAVVAVVAVWVAAGIWIVVVSWLRETEPAGTAETRAVACTEDQHERKAA
jgi:hypothetical protein